MFDLEKEIRNWLKALRRSEDLEDSDIAELESHLRDEIDHQIKKGVDKEAAFRAALEKSAPADILGQEYEKAKLYERTRPFWHPSRIMPSLIWSYIKISLRAIKRQKGFSLINIAGLAVGMAICILILIWVQDELSYDQFHANSDRIFRVIEHEGLSSGEVLSYTQQSPALGPVLKSEYPEILESVRYDSMSNRLVQYGDQKFYEKGFSFVDSEFLTVFTFPLKVGNPETALKDPASIVISERMAKKYFNQSDPMGKVLRIDNRVEYTVSGVLENVPENSHLKFEFLAPFATIKQFGQTIDGWYDFYLDIYVLLAENVDYHDVNAKVRNVISKHSKKDSFTVDLQPLNRIRLFSNTILTPQVEGDIKYVVIFSLVAVFILLNACINFMNLATARSGRRAKEIGMRKVIGASRRQLIRQFFGESILTAFISLIIAMGLVYLLLPAFSQLSGKHMSFSMLAQGNVLLGLLGITLFAGLISGVYPALVLSAFQPVTVLKRIINSGTRGTSFRRILVIFQFMMTSVLIIAMFVVFQQLNFLRKQDMGFAKDQVVCIQLPRDLTPKVDLLKTSFEKIPEVTGTSSASAIPGRRRALTSLDEWEGRGSEDRIELGIIDVDEDFLSLFDLEMVEGRFYSREFPSDKDEALVVNQAAIRVMSMENPQGKKVIGKRIVGVIKDFHMRSLHYKVAPLALILNKKESRVVFIKIMTSNPSQTIASLESCWSSIAPEYPFEYRFLDEDLEQLYQGDRHLGKVVNASAALALFVACLGLFGLASFVAEQRTKEIGIRKVLGASVPEIFSLLSRDFIKWVLIANAIAAPIAGYAMTKYLNTYAYHSNLGLVSFALPVILTLIVALLTIGWQVLRAAWSDPVRSLRYE
ncbi:MAG: FtsX-like permease family protein [Candidatus Aminicenantes bacterium]|nr:FtsX-like permease family protein [Candidatus Aminicenantes bacterium]